MPLDKYIHAIKKKNETVLLSTQNKYRIETDG